MVIKTKRKLAPCCYPRSQSGSLSILIPAFIVIALIGIGAIGMDISHNITVRTELQGATDASALAGARAMIDPATEKNAYNDAIEVAAENTADGKSVSNSDSAFTVMPQQDAWDNSTNSGTITVTASKTINNLFAKLFGHNTDTIATRSTAQCWRSINGIYANQAILPITVSLDTVNGHSQPLWKNKIGDVVSFSINSQQYKNAAFTSFNVKDANANFLTNMINEALGFTYDPTMGTPALTAGDPLYMTNGVAQQKQLAKGDYFTALTNPDKTFLIPVMTGDPPYNQTRKVVGFLTVRIKKVQINNQGNVESIDMQLVKGMVKGTGGTPSTGVGGGADNGMKDLSAGTCRLVS